VQPLLISADKSVENVPVLVLVLIRSLSLQAAPLPVR